MTLKLLPLLCLLAFLSCSQSDDQEYTFSTPRIKTIIYHYNDVTSEVHFTYDTRGRILQKIQPPVKVETYRYFSDTMIVVQRHINETLFHIDSLWLNDQGLAIIHKNWDKAMGPKGKDYIHTIFHEYNSQGYLIHSISGNYHYTYEIQDGNTVKEIHTTQSDDPLQDSIDADNYTVIYTYLPNSVNTIGNENMGMAFWGKQNKNLETGFGLTEFDWYTYHYDTKKRVSEEFDRSGGFYPARRFTYYE